MSYYLQGDRAFIGAIITQAYADAISVNKRDKPHCARRFISSKSPLWCFYCRLLGWNPHYVAKKIQERIRLHDEKREATRQFLLTQRRKSDELPRSVRKSAKRRVRKKK